MRKVNVNKIKRAVAELCITANTRLRSDVRRAIERARKKETHKATKRIFGILLENARIAEKENRAICQDTGLVSVYVRIGQGIRLVGGSLEDAINKGVKDGYAKGDLRKSVVKSPLLRTNTSTNAPSVIYTKIVNGEKLAITVMPKGFGSENKSKIKMLNPTEGEKEIISFVKEVVEEAGPDACPPYILGVGLGGTFDKASSLSKQALAVSIDKPNRKKYLRALEEAILKEVNKLKIGPMGFGTKTTCLGVNILEYPTHIAGLPVAVNVGCHVTRSASKVI